MKRSVWRLAAAVALGAACWSSRAPAQQQPPPATSDATSTREEVRALRELVNELNERLGRIEAQSAGLIGSGAAPAAAPSELDALRDQVYELNKRLRQIEVQAETDKAAAEAAAKKTPVVSAGAEGFSITSPDKAFQLKVGARVAYDVAFFKQDRELERAVGNEQDGVGFRYARIRLSGRVWENISHTLEFDFAGESGEDTPVFRDVYVQLEKIPYFAGQDFTFRVGHYREPFSLEELTPVPYRTFNERSLANVFVPSRNAGIQLSDALLGESGQERMTWAIGAFKETDNWPSSNDSDEDQGYQITARVTGLPWYADEGRKLLHLGLAYSLRNPAARAWRMARGRSHGWPCSVTRTWTSCRWVFGSATPARTTQTCSALNWRAYTVRFRYKASTSGRMWTPRSPATLPSTATMSKPRTSSRGSPGHTATIADSSGALCRSARLAGNPRPAGAPGKRRRGTPP